jgi:hypothetical protein
MQCLKGHENVTRGLEIVVEASKVLEDALFVRDSLPETMQNDGITVLLEKSRADPDPDQKFFPNPTLTAGLNPYP